MNARTRSDILALAGGDASSIAARRIRLNGCGMLRDEASRIAEEAIEFAIDAARSVELPNRDDLIRENEALRARLARCGDAARGILDDAEDE